MTSVQPVLGRDSANPLAAPARRMTQFAQLLRDLAGADMTASTAASRRLEERPPTAGELVVLLADRNPFVRSGAAWWLRHLASEPPTLVVDALRTATRDANPHVVQAALGTVGVLRLAAARDDTRRCLADPHPSVAHQAVYALGRIGPADEGRHLVRFLHAREAHLEKAAVVALTALRYTAAAPDLIARLERCLGVRRRLRIHFEMPRRYIQALVAFNARQVVPLLIRIARDEIGLRGIAVQGLIDLRAEEAAPALVPLLQRLRTSNTEERLCCSLLHLVTTFDYRFATGLVRSFLDHALSGVRIAALRAVAAWHDRDAVPRVRTMARHDPSAFVRPVAVSTLVDLADASSLPDLQALTEDSNALVRAAVAEALGRLAPLPADARLLLERLAADATPPVATTAAHALDHRADATPTPMDASTDRTPLVPAELTDQVTAARAFLQHWRSSFPDDAGDLPRALDVVLASLR